MAHPNPCVVEGSPQARVTTQTWRLPPGVLLRGTDVMAKFAEWVNYAGEFYFLFTSTGNQNECLTREMVM